MLNETNFEAQKGTVMAFAEVYFTGLGVIVISMTLLWLLSLLMKDASIVDIFWGAGFVIAGAAYYLLTDGYEGRRLLALGLLAVWGLRLTLHLARRNLGKGEDFRYARWRTQYGASWWWYSLFHVFLLQGLVMWIVSLPILAAQFHAEPAALTVLDLLGALVWLVGFIFEGLGDWQLARFRANPDNRGQVLNTGLWRYTRHPNYFGDAVQWWGFFLIALSTSWGWLTVVSPVVMTFLLMRVSGVAMLEKTLKKTRPEYQEYIETTSAFFPRPPRKP